METIALLLGQFRNGLLKHICGGCALALRTIPESMFLKGSIVCEIGFFRKSPEQ